MKIAQIKAILSDVAVTPIESHLYDIEIELLNNRKVRLAEYRNKALLIVNIASQCGFTKQLKQLQDLYIRYHKDGLEILGVPSDDFLQEPNDNAQIQQFCLKNFGVSFPILTKTHVRGASKASLYAFFTSIKTNPDHYGRVKWNFTKFLIDQEGDVRARFAPFTKPCANKVINWIEKLLS